MSVIDKLAYEFPHIISEVSIALLPLIVVFLTAQFTVLKLRLKSFVRICVGIVYAFVGLVLFLVGINVGFMPAGSLLGQGLVSESVFALIPIGLILGFVIVMAEPAVQVLNEQVYTVSGGNISKKSMLYSLSIGVGIAVAMAMVRIIYDFSIWWYIIPGYALSFVLMRFTPPVFTAIAFDSGGVASGPMTATFMLAFALGASEGLGGNVMSSAFGTVAMVAMTPLITIQLMGVIYARNTKEIEEDYNKLQSEIESSGDEIELYDSTDEESSGEETENDIHNENLVR